MRVFHPLPLIAFVTIAAVGGCGGGASPVAPSAADTADATTPSAEANPITSSRPATDRSVQTIVAPGSSVVDVEPALEQLWQATGDSAAPKDCTESPAVDAAGQVWVAACWGDRFWVFDEDGTFLEPWGKKGSEPGEFDFELPSGDDAVGGIAFAPDGTFYTYDVGNLRIQHFDASRKLLGGWGSFGRGDGQLAKPTDLAVGRDGDVYVADGARGDVQAFSPDGTFIRSMGDAVGQPDHFAWFGVDGDGNVYTAEGNHSIVKYAADGQPVFQIDCNAISGDTTDTAVDPDGNVFVSLTSDDEPFLRGLLEFDTEGTLLHRWPGIGDYIAIVDDGAAILATNSHDPYVKKFALPKD